MYVACVHFNSIRVPDICIIICTKIVCCIRAVKAQRLTLIVHSSCILSALYTYVLRLIIFVSYLQDQLAH